MSACWAKNSLDGASVNTDVCSCNLNDVEPASTFLTPPVAGALFLAAFVANCLRGALPPVDLRAVCLVRAMMSTFRQEKAEATFKLCGLCAGEL